jgi:hypothetical protein
MLLLVALLPACRPGNTKPVTRLVDFGIVDIAGPLQRHADPNTAVGFTSSGSGGSRFERRTTEIPAVQGCTFGLRYRVEGIPPGSTVTVEEIIRHPPITRPDGSVIGDEKTKDLWTPEDGVVDRKFLYILREPYEVVPGDWTLTVVVDGKPAIERHFNLVAPGASRTAKN